MTDDPSTDHPPTPSDTDAASGDASALPALFIIGARGVGKSTVGWALYTRVYQTGIPTAYVDLDQMGMCYPAPDDDPHNHRVKSHNLGIITTGYRRAGATRLVVTGALTTPNELQLYLDAIPDASWTTCRLTGSASTLRERIFRRGTGAGPVVPGAPTWSDAEALTRVADWSAEDALLMDTTRLGSVVITTDDLPVDTIVDNVLQTTRWAIGAQPST